jgi:hypothetical protein
MEFLQLTRIRAACRHAALPGLVLAALGLAALLVAADQPFRLASGRPGPGFVPTLLAAALVALGLLHAAGARPAAAPPPPPPPALAPAPAAAAAATPRAGLALSGAVALFAVLLPWAGFLPASWAAASLALAAVPQGRPTGGPAAMRRRTGVARIVLGGAVLAAANTALFLGALGLATPLFGTR